MKVKQYFHQSKLDENLGKCSVRKKYPGKPNGQKPRGQNPVSKTSGGKYQGVKTQ